MEETNNPAPSEQEVYTPRPDWQVWAARAGVVVMVGLIIWQIVQMAWGLW